jgi:hypothetical protein
MIGPGGADLPPGACPSLEGPGSGGAGGSPSAAEGREITVTGRRQRGAVIGDIPPERSLGPLDIRAYGASNLGELLQSLEPQIRSSRGRGDSGPVVLLNGKRVSGYREIANLPPEAIERMDVFPEELALKYGYRADQKVVNVVTYERFRSTLVQGRYGVATEGGRDTAGGTADYLRIQGDTRWNLALDYEAAGALLESERNVRQSAPPAPFDVTGNIQAAIPGGEIDPALSALAGFPVTVAGVPGGAGDGGLTLGSFVPGANDPNRTSLARHRSLLPATTRASVNGTVARPIFGNVSATLNLRYDMTESDSSFGLASAQVLLLAGNPFSPFASDVRLSRYVNPSRPLMRETDIHSAHAGAAFGGVAGKWLWSLTGNYDRISSTTFIDTGVDIASVQARLDAGDASLNPFADAGFTMRARDEARSVNSVGSAELVASRALFKLPAGEVYTSVRAGAATRRFSSESIRTGGTQSVELSRDRASGQINLDVPIARRDEKVLAALGNLSANANLEVEQLSDFGTLKTIGYGLTWSPVERLNLIASVTDEDGAPDIQQLGDPLLVTPNVRTFDFVRGETVDVTRVTGGNPDLRADNRHVFKLGLNAKPFAKTDLSFDATYLRSSTDDLIATFPSPTREIEAAFPERFTRDADGRLLRVDSRPVNFERRERQELRWGFNYSRALGSAPPGMRVEFRSASQGRPSNLPPGAVVRQVEPNSRMANQIESLLSRFILSVHHTWHLQDEILVKEGGPELDLLNGSAFAGRGGQPRHELEFQAGIFERALGARLTANWRSGTTVLGGSGLPGAGTEDLSFSSYGTINLQLFANLGQRLGVKKYPWLRGTRLSLGVNNLLDSRPSVRDETGATPLGYQGPYLEPLGRSLTLTLRKLFT